MPVVDVVPRFDSCVGQLLPPFFLKFPRCLRVPRKLVLIEKPFSLAPAWGPQVLLLKCLLSSSMGEMSTFHLTEAARGNNNRLHVL